MGLNSSTPVTMSSAVANSIRQRIAQSTVVIYSKTHCPYCTMAKEVTCSCKLIHLNQSRFMLYFSVSVIVHRF